MQQKKFYNIGPVGQNYDSIWPVEAAPPTKNFFKSKKIIAIKTKEAAESLSFWANCLKTFFSEILLTVWQK
jgi:hypothetical protein